MAIWCASRASLPGAQIVDDLARREQQPFRTFTVVADHRRETPLGQIPQRRRGGGRAQQALGGHCDERLAPAPQRLAPQEMEVLRRGGGLADLHVVLGGELEEALEPGAGVLRPLPLVAVRQQQDEARQKAPLVLPRAR